MSMLPLKGKKLESLNREELVQTVRRLLAEADALSSRIAAVSEIGVAINEKLDIPTILKVVAKQAKWLLDFQHLSVSLEEGASWRLVTLFGEEAAEPEDWQAAENIGTVLRTRQARLFRDGCDSDFLARYKSQIIVPLKVGNDLLGTINFAATEAEKYTQDDMRIGYMLSLQVSSALQNAKVLEQLQSTQNELELRIQDLDAYNHTIAHDLRSPLSGISLSAELIEHYLPDDVPDKVRKYTQGIRASVKQMDRMVEQLLLLAKLRHEESDLEIVDVNAVVENAVQRFSMQLEQKNIVVHRSKDLPRTMAHDQWIEEIFANFISNAIKYMGDNNPSPSITIRGETLQDGRVRYEVQDTGIGISEDDVETLFEMFTRVEGSTVEGLGLGLSIVRRIIMRLNGDVGVDSTVGEGSTFWFVFDGVVDAILDPNDATLQDNPAEQVSDKSQALVIEDDESLSIIFQGALERSGFETHIVNDSTQAMATIRRIKPKLITLDMQMPEINGATILEQIRADDELKDMKVMVITASTQSQHLATMEAEPDIVLSKPVTLSQIQMFVERIMPKESDT